MYSSKQNEKLDYLLTSYNNESLSKIQNLLSNIIQKQNENTIIKKKLFSYKGFYPEILFLKLDYFSKKNITTLDFLHYLEQHRYKFNDEIIRRFIKQYDKHGNFNLIYEDFTNMVLPFDNNYEKINFEEKEGGLHDRGGDMDAIFCEILINELKLIGLIGDLIIDIRKNEEFDTYKIFEIISNKEKYLNGEMIFNFLQGNYSNMEINRLVYYLDSNNDGLITYDDFQDLLLPIKGDFENSEYMLSECCEEDINYSLNNGIYNNYMSEYVYQYNLKSNNMYNISNNRKTYFINYKTTSRNKIPNIKKNLLNLVHHKNQIKTDKDLITQKYLNYSVPIHEQNETYENPTTNEENNKNDYNKNINKNDENIPTKDEINNQIINNEDDITNINNIETSKEINQEQEIKNHDINKNEKSEIKIKDKDKEINNEQNFVNINNNNENNLGTKEEKTNKKNDNNSNDDINIKEKSDRNNSNNDIIITDRNNKKEDINEGVDLQKFPNTFGKNQDNDNSSKKDNKNDNIQNIKENINYINQDNSIKKLNKDALSNSQNHKTKKNIHKKNIINNNIQNIQNKTFHIKSKLNLESNDYQYNDIIPPNTYNFPLIEDRNININIKSNNYHNDYSIIIDAMSIFFEYINSIIYYENRVEHIKESLALREDLSLKEIFYLFDKDKVKHISLDNFQFICKTVFKIFPTKDQITLVFKRYKKDLNINTNKTNTKKDCSLSQNEFMLMLYPKKSEYLSLIVNKNKTDKTKLKLSKKSKNILVELIKCLILKESNYYKIRCQLEQNSLEYIWKEICKFSTYGENGESINKTQFNQFLEEYGYFFGQKHLNIIFSIFDKEKKDLIKDIDFFEEMCCE